MNPEVLNEFMEMIVQETTKRVLAEVNKNIEYSQDEILTRKDLEKMFDKSSYSISKLINNNPDFPVHKVGNKDTFSKQEVLDWHRKHKYIKVSEFDGLKD